MEMTWTPERVEMLNRLFEEGLPTSEIGRRMGLTKNTIIGRLHRNGMTRRETGPKFVPQRNFFEFSGPGCLWPHGHPDDPQFHFCGARPATRQAVLRRSCVDRLCAAEGGKEGRIERVFSG